MKNSKILPLALAAVLSVQSVSYASATVDRTEGVEVSAVNQASSQLIAVRTTLEALDNKLAQTQNLVLQQQRSGKTSDQIATVAAYTSLTFGILGTLCMFGNGNAEGKGAIAAGVFYLLQTAVTAVSGYVNASSQSERTEIDAAVMSEKIEAAKQEIQNQLSKEQDPTKIALLNQLSQNLESVRSEALDVQGLGHSKMVVRTGLALSSLVTPVVSLGLLATRSGPLMNAAMVGMIITPVVNSSIDITQLILLRKSDQLAELATSIAATRAEIASALQKL